MEVVYAESLEQAVDRAVAEYYELLRLIKKVYAVSAEVAASPEESAKVEEAKQQYLTSSAALRETIKLCIELREQRLTQQQANHPVDDPNTVAALERELQALKNECEQKNETMKQLIDQLRHLSDAFNMWDSYKKQLDNHSNANAAQGGRR